MFGTLRAERKQFVLEDVLVCVPGIECTARPVRYSMWCPKKPQDVLLPEGMREGLSQVGSSRHGQ